MWACLWILPLIFLIWAIVLVAKKVRRAGNSEADTIDEQAAREERIRRAMEEPDDEAR